MNDITEHIERKILSQHTLTVVHEDMARLSQEDKEAFTLLRRSGFGASDSSVILGVNKWLTLDNLIEQKQQVGITEEEKAIGEKPAVRKGADLEPLILKKFSEQFGVDIAKPSPMYKIIESPTLTINFDGVIEMGGQLFPVEAKFVSAYAGKYWNKSMCISNLGEGTPKVCGGSSVQKHIEEEAQLYGIPPYYYTQVQQQLLGLNADFGYLVGLFDYDWVIRTYKIYKDEFVQRTLIQESAKAWNLVTKKEA